MNGKLYLVATPIGNLQDITFRAIEVLRAVDLIACEDTRHSRKLLNAYEIDSKLVSYHDHNESERSSQLLKRLVAGESIAIITDAGTPGISDPGYRLVRLAREAGVDVVPVPGAAAFVAAATVSGLPTDAVFFGGFLPSRTGDRRGRLAEVKDIPATLVFYEAPHRITQTLGDCLDVLGDREASVCRELTKLNEEVVNGTLSHLAERFAEGTKGEIVLVISHIAPEGQQPASTEGIFERYSELIGRGEDRRSALKIVAREFGVPRAEAYRILEAKKDRGT